MSKAITFRTKSGEKVYTSPYMPIGSIYLSVNNTNPSTYFGGTWTQIKDKFLLTAGSTYSAGSTGGSANHYHGYRVGYYPFYGALIGNDDRGIQAYDYNAGTWKYASSDSGLPGSGIQNTAIAQSSKSMDSAKYSVYGTTTLENSLPPYLVVYAWKRTA